MLFPWVLDYSVENLGMLILRGVLLRTYAFRCLLQYA